MNSPSDKNINLLQGDSQKKQEVEKKFVAEPSPEYSQPEEDKEKAAPPGLFSSLFKRFFSRKEKKSVALPARQDNLQTNIFLNKTSLRPEKINKQPAIQTPPTLSKIEPPVAAPAESGPAGAPEVPVPSPAAQAETAPEGLRSRYTGLGVNLLSEEYADRLRSVNRKSFFVWFLVITILFIGLVWLSVKLYSLQQNRSASGLARANQALEQKIAAFSELAREDELLSRKAQTAEFLLSGHVFWPSFLTSLESVTIPEVTYLNISAGRAGRVTLNALATDYTAAGRQLNLLEKGAPWVKKVSITAATLTTLTGSETKNVVFDLNLVVDPKIFEPSYGTN